MKQQESNINPHLGEPMDDFWDELGIVEEITINAVIETVSWILKEHINTTGKTKIALAKELKTSRSQLDRLLNPERENSDISLSTIMNVGKITGKKVKLEFV